MFGRQTIGLPTVQAGTTPSGRFGPVLTGEKRVVAGVLVVGGEALVDLVPADPAAAGPLGPLLPRLGGGPYNTAIAAARLGAPVAFLSRVSTDAFGDAVVDALTAAGVGLELLQRGAEPTTLAVVTLAGDGSARYTFHVQGTADRLVADPGPLPAEVTAVALGTLSLVLEPGASAYEAVLRRAAAAGKLTVLDPNIRTGLIEDPEAYRLRFSSWLPDVGVVKASEEDARWLAGADEHDAAETIAQTWLAAGAGAVVLTRGADGLSAYSATAGRVDVPGVPTTVADTIGAGDTVHAALLAWLHEHAVRSADDVRRLAAGGWREALDFAARAASVTVSRVGAEPPFAHELPAERNTTVESSAE
jgi:fructokinase